MFSPKGRLSEIKRRVLRTTGDNEARRHTNETYWRDKEGSAYISRNPFISKGDVRELLFEKETLLLYESLFELNSKRLSIAAHRVKS